MLNGISVIHTGSHCIPIACARETMAMGFVPMPPRGAVRRHPAVLRLSPVRWDYCLDPGRLLSAPPTSCLHSCRTVLSLGSQPEPRWPIIKEST